MDSVLGSGKDSRKFSGRIVDSDMHDVRRFLHRLLGLPPETQNKLFELVVSILDLLIQNARTEGHLDSGIVDVKANSVELQGTPKSALSLLEEKQQDYPGLPNSGFYESRREWLGRRHFILAFEGSASGMYKVFRPTIGESLREMPKAELKDKYRKNSSLEKACSGWDDEYDVSSKQCMPKLQARKLLYSWQKITGSERVRRPHSPRLGNY